MMHLQDRNQRDLPPPRRWLRGCLGTCGGRPRLAGAGLPDVGLVAPALAGAGLFAEGLVVAGLAVAALPAPDLAAWGLAEAGLPRPPSARGVRVPSGCLPVPAGWYSGIRCFLLLPMRSSRPISFSASRSSGQLSG